MLLGVCGLAINVSTSALCLRRLVRFADFLLEERQELDGELHGGFPGNAAATVEELRATQGCFRSQT